MTTFSALSLIPLSGIISAAALGTFLAWLMVAILAVTAGGLLPMIFASIYGNAKREAERLVAVKNIGLGTDLACHNA